jgi:MoxR-like ATPase
VARVLLATHPADASSGPLVRRHLRHGASPRGGLAILAAARARALLRGRMHVTREDLDAVWYSALAHRVVPAFGTEPGGDAVRTALQEACQRGHHS